MQSLLSGLEFTAKPPESKNYLNYVDRPAGFEGPGPQKYENKNKLAGNSNTAGNN